MKPGTLMGSDGGYKEMPRYLSHKRVWALRIKEVELKGDGKGLLHFTDSGYKPLEVSGQFIENKEVCAGGYYVVYVDGYASFSPPWAFEEGYKLEEVKQG
jgi:hypothetical protein